MSTPAINAAIRARFCPPEWALFFEVGDATGGRHRRWADAVAMNLYPSRGLSICGFEVKASRSDWLRELKSPDKSGPVQQYCNTWSIVTLPGIVQDGELPPTWGLYELQAGGVLRQKVAAPALTPIPVTKDFVAAMLRRASEIDHAEVHKLVEKGIERERADINERVQREVERRTRDWDKVKKTVDEIRQHCGIDLIHGWEDAKSIARAFKLARDSKLVSEYGGLAHLAAELERGAAQVRAALKSFEAPHAPEQASPEAA